MNDARSASVLSLRRFDAGCIEPFLTLAATYYPVGHDARDPAYLRWAFLENPVGVGRLACATGADGRLTAMMGLIPFRIRNGANEFVANMVVNVLVHPDHRKEKLFVKMIQHTRAELATTGEWLIGHPNDAAVPGWRRTNMGFRPGYDVRVALPGPRSRNPGERNVSKKSDPIIAADFAPLRAWQASLGHPVIAADAAFLKWRFLDHPSKSYRLRVREGAHGVTGYRVDRPFKTRFVRWFVDWQGADAWARGPAQSHLPSLFAWPCDDPSPPGLLLPRVRKRYAFFATPTASVDNDGDPWTHVTLAATDFA